MPKGFGIIEFNLSYPGVRLNKRRALKDFIFAMFKAENKMADYISITFLSDHALLKMNRAYLNHDYHTDILTFDLSSTKNLVSGDIYISVERVKENAGINAVSFEKELHRVIFHGVLHLLGYRDKTSRQVNLIRLKEDYNLSRYFVSRETQ